MKLSLLALLLLSVPAVAQFRPMYSAPRPSSPRPTYSAPPPSLYHPTTNPNVNYRAQQAQQQQAHQNFQAMQAQQLRNMQDQQLRNQQQAILQRQHLLVGQPRLRRAATPEQLAQAQQQAEQQANEQLAHLSTEQQQRRQDHPAANAQEAEAQQQADARQLTQLAVKNYREVFLPGQLLQAIQSLTLSPQAEQDLQALNGELLNNAWWRQQEAAQLPVKIAAHGKTLAGLTTSLLGAAPAPTPAAVPANALNEMLTRNTFDQATANQLIREAAQADKQMAGERLTQAVQDFTGLSARVAASPAAPEGQKQQRDEVKQSLKRVNKELLRYNAQVGRAGQLVQTQKAIMKATSNYLATTDH